MTAANDPEHSEYNQGQADYKNKVIYRPGRSKEYKNGYRDGYFEDLKSSIKKHGGLR